MHFKDILNNYIDELGCSVKQLVEVTGLSASVISRYRSGERTPTPDSPQLKKLAEGIVTLSQVTPSHETSSHEISSHGKNLSDTPSVSLSIEEVMKEFTAALLPDIDSVSSSSKIDYLIGRLGINVSAMSKALSYDASFISRIRSGSRMPSNPNEFVQKFAFYLVQNYSLKELMPLLGDAIPAGTENISTADLQNRIGVFLQGEHMPTHDHTSDFLHKLDEFDLKEFIRSIKFDEIKIPSAPFQFHTAKEYLGVDGQKKSELDFLKGTVLSKNNDTVFMCSDMDMKDMAEDIEFSKKWMFGLAMVLKRGLNIHIIHNLNRPYNELMLGLIAWIPLYMTGQVTPFYLNGTHNELYQHLLYTSGSYALSGECIKGFHNEAKYTLTSLKKEADYYKSRAAAIMKKAHSLMDIYTPDTPAVFHSFARASEMDNGNRHYISSSLPVIVLENEHLTQILKKNGLTDSDTETLIKKISAKRDAMDKILVENKLYQELPYISKEEFAEHPLVLDLTEYDYYLPVTYSYEDYTSHVDAVRAYAESHDNYTYTMSEDFAFRNIQIRILEGKWVWISKIKSPVIHFVIRHPMLRNAIENMQVSFR